MRNCNRRDFFRDAAGLSMLAGVRNLRSQQAGSVWDQVPAILARIQPPVFPKRDFDITRYGAAGDGAKDCTNAIAKAIDACSQAGGGRVIVPAGVFLTGPVRLKSNIDLHIAADATLRFVRDPKRYLPLVYTRWEGLECLNYSAFIYSDGQNNLAITGEGTLDGNCDCEHWWPWKGRTNCGWKKGDPDQAKDRAQLFDMAEHGVPVNERIFGQGHYLRPQFLQPYRCKNVLIEDVTITNSPMFEIHPILCSNV